MRANIKHLSYIILTGLILFSIQSCKKKIQGCTDSTSTNYNSEATVDDGSCTYISGCTDPNAGNYNPEATQEDNNCNTWPEEIAGIYDGELTCTLFSVINGPFTITIESVDEDHVNVNMDISGFQSFPMKGVVDKNMITFDPLDLDGLDIEIPDQPLKIKGIEVNGDLEYQKAESELDGNLVITLKTDLFPLTDNCTITATRR